MQILKIVETVKEDNKDVLMINIAYPQLIDDCKLKKKFNHLYAMQAMQFRSYILNKLAPIAKEKCGVENFNKFGASLTFTQTYNDNKFISMFSDVIIYNGKITAKKRITYVWDKDYCCIVKLKNLYKLNKEFKNVINEYKSLSNDQNTYILQKLDTNHFCLEKTGIVLFQNTDKIFLSNQPFISCTIPYKAIEKFKVNF